MLVLIGYATCFGSTRGVAERIGTRLGNGGLGVDVRSLELVEEAAAYDAAVLGSAIHDRAWLPEAARFLRRESGVLASRPVWLFSVGLARAMGGRWEAKAPEPQEVADFRKAAHPLDHRLFAGAVRPEHLPRAGRLAYRLMRGRYGDFRNWQEIDAWADGIAHHLRDTGPTTH
ncbi:flavodoxin domain-containing protein [Wenjunlia tyrosinilytica]|uniref:Flavodoxin n=1 Tax=Wenjunlia tyrosinilytica TaxID=1544741 RepID=A0A917ZTC5_9ACTN|nr:flavodoxin domain-containing protein [Wenjunlia tyrosinilytica]GGO90476.1 flavodoxin [Wenjunlia tyrosinilytica]